MRLFGSRFGRLEPAFTCIALLMWLAAPPDGKADAALVASMVHYGEYRVSELKQYLQDRGLKMRMSW